MLRNRHRCEPTRPFAARSNRDDVCRTEPTRFPVWDDHLRPCARHSLCELQPLATGTSLHPLSLARSDAGVSGYNFLPIPRCRCSRPAQMPIPPDVPDDYRVGPANSTAGFHGAGRHSSIGSARLCALLDPDVQLVCKPTNSASRNLDRLRKLATAPKAPQRRQGDAEARGHSVRSKDTNVLNLHANSYCMPGVTEPKGAVLLFCERLFR